GNYKQEITIRHLLEHTSGIKTQNNTARILLSSNKIRHALNSSIVSKPGTKFVYNNNAVNVLSGIIEKASGQKADSFINTYLFKPLNITDYSWAEDKAGNPTAYAGLDLLPEDLAKIGLLLLHDGKWNGQQIISKQWIKESTSSSKISEKWAYPTGFLWWCERDIVSFKIRESVFDSIKKIGVDTLIVSKLNKLREKEIPVNEFEPLLKHTLGHDYKYFREILKEYNLQLMKIILGKTIGFSAEGWLGQWLIVIPEKKIVAVRMIDLKNAKKFGNTNFYNFLRLVPKLK
ncbi:MAG TPA: serine hydrolase, partial [Bacteroidia bacterium]|nr:serine hydrolase [Bacteroidia bacterium]